MYLIVGLGNPGRRYENTFHNIGFEMVQTLAPGENWKNQRQSLTHEINIHGHKCLLALPQTFMNCSGDSVSKLLHFFKIPLENLIVVLDDINLPLGKVRVRLKGSHGGHNGLRDIIRIAGPNFTRIRFGVGPAPVSMVWKNFVLQKMKGPEKEIIAQVKLHFPEIVGTGLKMGWEKAASQFNGALIQ